MSSKGKVIYGFSFRAWTLTIIILCAVIWWASAGSPGLARDETANPSARHTISLPVGPPPSVNRAEKSESESGPLLLSSLFEPTAGVRGFTNFHAERTIRHQIIQSLPDQAGANVYSLLDDGRALGRSLYGYRTKYFLSIQRSADSEPSTHGKSLSARRGNDATSTTIRQAAVIILFISLSNFPHGH